MSSVYISDLEDLFERVRQLEQQLEALQVQKQEKKSWAPSS